ncbi:MAG: DUF4247 domain-containing protein [bacterium]
MDKKGLYIFVGGLILILIILISSSSINRGPNIAKAISDKYPLKSTEGSIRIYNSSEDVNSTVFNIRNIKRPYDEKIENDGTTGILLYHEAVIIVEDKEGNTEIELIRDHQRAYNRHRNTMIMFWGNNLYSNGRIQTPRSIREGSVRSSSSRGGGFSFGK